MATRKNGYIVEEHWHDGMVFPGHVPVAMEGIKTMDYRPDDLLVISYPKCGSTWLQQLGWLITHDADIKRSRKESLYERTSFLENLQPNGYGLDLAAALPSPRVMKCHLPVRYFDKIVKDHAAKVVVVMRNVKDCLVSGYHFFRMNKILAQFTGTFDEYFEMFKNKTLIYGDYFDHVNGWWQYRNEPNVLVVFYEDLKKDLKKEVEKIAKFYGKDLKESDIDAIVKECTFESMKANPMTNLADVPVFDKKEAAFLRKGVVGDWQNYFNAEQNAYIEDLWKERIVKAGIPIRFTI